MRERPRRSRLLWLGPISVVAVLGLASAGPASASEATAGKSSSATVSPAFNDDFNGSSIDSTCQECHNQ